MFYLHFLQMIARIRFVVISRTIQIDRNLPNRFSEAAVILALEGQQLCLFRPKQTAGQAKAFPFNLIFLVYTTCFAFANT